MRGLVTTRPAPGRRAVTSYGKLEDAALRHGVMELSSGRVQVWLVKAGTRWTRELTNPEMPCLTWRPKNLHQSHKLVGMVRGSTNLAELFKILAKTAHWAPNGEHKSLLGGWGLAKSSIGVGDLLIGPRGKVHMFARWHGKFSGPLWDPNTTLQSKTGEFAAACCPKKGSK